MSRRVKTTTIEKLAAPSNRRSTLAARLDAHRRVEATRRAQVFTDTIPAANLLGGTEAVFHFRSHIKLSPNKVITSHSYKNSSGLHCVVVRCIATPCTCEECHAKWHDLNQQGRKLGGNLMINPVTLNIKLTVTPELGKKFAPTWRPGNQ